MSATQGRAGSAAPDATAEPAAEHEFALVGDREHVERLQPYLDERPRSIVRPGAYLLLDGEWRFERDPDDRGLAERWYLRHEYTATAHWPGSVVNQVERTKPTSRDEVIVWYERDFVVPSEWRRSPHPVQLTFGACGYETRVWLNGTQLRTIEGEDAHLGEYTSFSFELPDELLQDVNRLTVRVADSLDPDWPRGKQESRVYKRGGIWYQAVSGPVRSVWLEPVERNRLRSRLSVVSNVADRLVELGVTTRIRDAGLYRLHVVVAALGEDVPCAMNDYELLLEAGEQRQHVVLDIPSARLWSTASPALYRVIAQLCTPDGRVSQIEARIGLRQFAARGRWLYLNDECIYVDGILYQPGTATFEQMRRHLSAMRELGCNLVRVHVAGIDPRIYSLADELGMLLWLEVPSPHRSSPRSRAAHWTELQRKLVHVASHPSVVLLSLYNESWGAEDIAGNDETRAYISRAADYVRRNYPQLLVIDNDGWQHVSTEGRLETDVLTAHLYRNELESWRDALDRYAAGETNGVTALPLVVGDPFFYAGQVPLVVSEWGGFGFSLYGGPDETALRAEWIRTFKAAIAERRISGDVYTQATNVEQEDNGLLDADTGELFVPSGLLRSERGAGPRGRAESRLERSVTPVQAPDPGTAPSRRSSRDSGSRANDGRVPPR